MVQRWSMHYGCHPFWNWNQYDEYTHPHYSWDDHPLILYGLLKKNFWLWHIQGPTPMFELYSTKGIQSSNFVWNWLLPRVTTSSGLHNNDRWIMTISCVTVKGKFCSFTTLETMHSHRFAKQSLKAKTKKVRQVKVKRMRRMMKRQTKTVKKNQRARRLRRMMMMCPWKPWQKLTKMMKARRMVRWR